jgi:hypothetical protein
MMPQALGRSAAGVLALFALGACQAGEGLDTLFGSESATEAQAEAPDLDTGDEPSPPAVPAGPVEVAVPTIDGETAWEGVLSAGATDMRVTARDQRDWGILWQLVGREPPGALPEGAMAVGIFLGTRPTAGYSVDYLGASETPDQITLQWREQTPGPDQMLAQVVTAPWAIRLLPASDRPVGFQREP